MVVKKVRVGSELAARGSWPAASAWPDCSASVERINWGSLSILIGALYCAELTVVSLTILRGDCSSQTSAVLSAFFLTAKPVDYARCSKLARLTLGLPPIMGYIGSVLA